MEKHRPVILTILFVAVSLSSATESWGRGWGDDYNWFNDVDKAKEAASKENKPIMVVIHKSWCGACKALKPNVATSPEMKQRADKFIMVNLEDEEEPKDPMFAPDGGYIPRIFFMSPEGEVNADIINEKGNSNYKYYYSSPAMIAESMDKALSLYGTKTKRDDEL